MELCISVCEWCECFNFCTGRSPTVTPVWNSLLFWVAVFRFGTPFWVLSTSALGVQSTQGGGSVLITWFNTGSEFVRLLLRVHLIPE